MVNEKVYEVIFYRGGLISYLRCCAGRSGRD